MARKARIDKLELNRLLTVEEKSPSECAEIFGVSRPAISQAIKELKINITATTAFQATPIVYRQELNTLDQLNKVNKHANEILDLAMKSINGTSNEEDIKKLKLLAKINGSKDHREIAIKCMREIQNQLRLQLEIYQKLYDLQAAEEFQKEVLAAIGEVEPDVRDKIIHRLGKNRAIRSAIQSPSQ